MDRNISDSQAECIEQIFDSSEIIQIDATAPNNSINVIQLSNVKDLSSRIHLILSAMKTNQKDLINAPHQDILDRLATILKNESSAHAKSKQIVHEFRSLWSNLNISDETWDMVAQQIETSALD